MDADWHDPLDIIPLVTFKVEENADLVIGSRALGSVERYSLVRNRCKIIWVSLDIASQAFGSLVSPQAAFRPIDVCQWSKLALRERQFHTAELIVEMVRSGCSIKEFPVNIKKRKSGESKKGKDIFYAVSFLRVCQLL